MRIFSSAENCRRVARRISLTTCSAGFFTGPDFCPIFAPSMATMGQNSSLPQPALSVSQVLMPDKLDVESRGLFPRLAGCLRDQRWMNLRAENVRAQTALSTDRR